MAQCICDGCRNDARWQMGWRGLHKISGEVVETFSKYIHVCDTHKAADPAQLDRSGMGNAVSATLDKVATIFRPIT